MNNISKANAFYAPEPLSAAFGFKGSSLSELWQICCQIEDDQGFAGTGLGVQSVLWSDSSVFSMLGQKEGNRAMYDTTCHAVSLLENRSFHSPPEVLGELLTPTLDYARKRTRTVVLRTTFALNALVSVDFACWQLYAAQRQITDFDHLMEPFTRHLAHHHDKLGIIPLITYGTSEEEILRLVEEGCFLLKIKIGSDPGQDGSQDKMLAWDCERLLQIHRLVGEHCTPYTDCGHPVYYLDANGRYESLAQVQRLLDFADRHDILERVLLLEEPFAEASNIPAGGLPVRVAADESAHCLEDVQRLISLGYGAFALKPIAKTLSMTLRILEEAQKYAIPCFCADLTVNPLMVEWNKNIACRIPPLPGLKIGVVESNGPQNYRNWKAMQQLFPYPEAEWFTGAQQYFNLTNDYYENSGGVLIPPAAYIEQIKEGHTWNRK